MGEDTPSLFDKAFSLSTATKEVLENAVKTGKILTEKDTLVHRWQTCTQCESFDQTGFISTCRECGCGMRVKTRLAASTCPLNKW